MEDTVKVGEYYTEIEPEFFSEGAVLQCETLYWDGCHLFKAISGTCRFNNASEGGPGAYQTYYCVQPYIPPSASDEL